MFTFLNNQLIIDSLNYKQNRSNRLGLISSILRPIPLGGFNIIILIASLSTAQNISNSSHRLLKTLLTCAMHRFAIPVSGCYCSFFSLQSRVALSGSKSLCPIVCKQSLCADIQIKAWMLFSQNLPYLVPPITDVSVYINLKRR